MCVLSRHDVHWYFNECLLPVISFWIYIYIYSQHADAETLFASAIPGFTESWHGAWCLMPAESDRGII